MIKRKNFSAIKSVIDYPDFLDIQLKSFQDFFQLDTPPENRAQEGLFKVFSENFPISDSRVNFVLEFIDYLVDPPKYNVDESIDRGLTYSVPLKAKLRLSCNDEDNEDFETIEQEVFLGNIPYMTKKGSFVINGAERARVVGLKLAIASSSPVDWVRPHIERLGLSSSFDAIATRDDVENAKPAADLYLLATSQLGVDPGEAIAFEDSPAGVASAKAAGLYCVAVPGPMTRSLSLENADATATSLADQSLDEWIAAAQQSKPC